MMTEVIAFTLGFFCALGLVMVRNRPQRYGVETEELPKVPIKLFRSAPDNEKARKFATGQYMREKEEAITRGEGYPE